MDYPENEPVFSISTAAKLLQISVHTVRMYEREGLVLPTKSESGQRLYSMKDIERIESIRRSINEYKISIAGIKALLSMVPCWKVMGCGESKNSCKVFKEHTKPCWTIKHRQNFCAKRVCRDCNVYNEFSESENIKNKIYSLFLN
jgi:MerR family transcriptional regulator/heat shock protein HspR